MKNKCSMTHYCSTFNCCLTGMLVSEKRLALLLVFNCYEHYIASGQPRGRD